MHPEALVSPTAPPLRTPLHDWHQSHGGRLVEFGGWSMPVQYTTIIEEHVAVRQRVGLFDIS
ncbi:MAG: glycine cleavage system aminomethyltransferase GcvT, partial [Isosphaeraceae bacterium]